MCPSLITVAEDLNKPFQFELCGAVTLPIPHKIYIRDGLQSIPRQSNDKDVSAMLDELTIEAN